MSADHATPPSESYSNRKVRLRSKSTLALSFALFVGTAIAVGFLGTLVDANGTPYVHHFSPVLVQIIATAGIIVPTVLPYLIRTHKASEASKEQLQNDHQVNHRDELDQRHQVMVSAVNHIDRRLGSVSTQLGDLQTANFRMWNKLGEIDNALRGVSARQTDLEDTINPRKEKE